MSNSLRFSASHRAVAALSATGTLSTPTNRYQPSFVAALTSGTGIGKGDQSYGAEITLAAGATTVIDLQEAQADGLGGIVTIARLKYLFVASQNAATDNATLIIGAPNTSSEYFELDQEYGGALPHEEAVGAGGCLIRFDPVGWPVVHNITDWLYIHNSGLQAATFDILVVGASA